MKNLLLVLLLINLLSCKSVYVKSPIISQRIQTHKKIAILPPYASFSDYKKVDDSTKVKIDDNYWVQYAIYNYLVEKKQEWKLEVDFQNIATTQKILRDANISLDSLHRNKIAVAELLEVDAVIYAEGYVEQIGIRSLAAEVSLSILVDGLFGGRPSYRMSNSDAAFIKIAVVDREGVFWEKNKYIKGRITKNNQKQMLFSAYVWGIEEFPYRNR